MSSYLISFLLGLFVTSTWCSEKEKKLSEEVIYCNNGAEAGEAWSSIRHTIRSMPRSPLSVTFLTHSYFSISSSVKLLLKEWWKKMFHSGYSRVEKKGNSSCGQSYVSIDSTESGKMLSPHQDDKNWAKFNYISVKCEDSFKNQNGSHSMSVWAFTIILFSSWSSLEMMWAVTEWPDWLVMSKQVYVKMGLAGS